MALICWTKIIIEPLKERLVKLLLEEIYLCVQSILIFIVYLFFFFDSDRIGKYVNQTTIKNVIMSFVEVYQNRRINRLEVNIRLNKLMKISLCI